MYQQLQDLLTFAIEAIAIIGYGGLLAHYIFTNTFAKQPAKSNLLTNHVKEETELSIINTKSIAIKTVDTNNITLPELQQLAESLGCYQSWLYKLLKAYQQQQTRKLEGWERAYLRRVIKLAKNIRDGVITDLICFCIDLENYQSNGSNAYKCHTQLLYKVVLQIQQITSH